MDNSVPGSSGSSKRWIEDSVTVAWVPWTLVPRAISVDAVSAGQLGVFPTLTSGRRGGATAASRCKESLARERAMPESRGQPCYDADQRKKRKGEKERENRTKEDEVWRRRERPAQKRANVGKIGGGSQQLLAGMSGNAWDSILKARPRQSPVMPLRVPLFQHPWGPV